MKNFLEKMIPVSPSDRFAFRCRQCGACCRHVKQSVIVETLDAFRLAKHLRNRNHSVESMDEFLFQYTEPVLLHESGYSVFMLKTVGEEDACIFLKDNKCMVHAVKPRACRTYPVETGPDARGGYEQYLSKEQPHHFSGPQTTVKRWLGRYLSNTDRAFVEEDTGSAKEMAMLLGELQELNKKQAMILFVFYRYSAFDLDKAFLPQFLNNNRELKKALKNLAWKKDLQPMADLKNLNSGK